MTFNCACGLWFHSCYYRGLVDYNVVSRLCFTVYDNVAGIKHGATIGLQFKANMGKWLGCAAGHTCYGVTCPRMIFTGADWNNCWGEVFQIYRPLGPGDIRSGDFVALYNSRTGHSRWFSLYLNRAHMVFCPGSLNPTTGEVIRCYTNNDVTQRCLSQLSTFSLAYN